MQGRLARLANSWALMAAIGYGKYHGLFGGPLGALVSRRDRVGSGLGRVRLLTVRRSQHERSISQPPASPASIG